MKYSRKVVELLILSITAFALIITMLFMLQEDYYYGNEKILSVAIVLVVCLTTSYLLIMTRRMNPNVYIFVSYSMKNKDIADIIYNTLTNQLPSLSKYRFKLLWDEAVPLGADINETLQDYIKKSEIIIVIVSSAYVNSEMCQSEFDLIFTAEKKIIPVVTECYDDLSKLSHDISNIKALPLFECDTDEERKKYIIEMGKDLIRQRRA